MRDLPSGGRPVVLVWFKRIWRCQEPRYSQRVHEAVSALVHRRLV